PTHVSALTRCPPAPAPRTLLSFPPRRSSDLTREILYPLDVRGFRHGQHPADVAEALFGIDQVAEDLDVRTVLQNPVTASESRVQDRKSTRLNSSHVKSSYAVFGLKKKRHDKG